MKENLKKAIELIKKHRFHVAAVFDLDSTLFCMKYRTEAIIKTFIKNNNHELSSETVSFINKLTVTERDWSVEEILARYGVSSENPLVKTLYKHWRKYFFKDDFLYLDRPYPGGSKYIKLLKEQGTSIFYLTGRNKNTMLSGSLNSLKKWNFPLEQASHLILKEDTTGEDSLYKMNELKRIQDEFKTVLFFENEPVILNVIAKELPQIKLFWMDSTHSRKQSPPKKALTIPMDYRL